MSKEQNNEGQTEMTLPEITTFEHYYFKDSGVRPWTPLLSGLALPIDPDGVCRNVKFVGCNFHPVCSYVKFENCEFVGCEDPRIEWGVL